MYKNPSDSKVIQCGRLPGGGIRNGPAAETPDEDRGLLAAPKHVKGTDQSAQNTQGTAGGNTPDQNPTTVKVSKI